MTWFYVVYIWCTVSLNVALCPVVAVRETPYRLKGPKMAEYSRGVVSNYLSKPSRMNGI